MSPKVAGGTASLMDPAVDSILSFAAEAGLVVILHNDVNVPFAKPGSAEASLNLPSLPAAPVPAYLAQLTALLRRHPTATVIWAHTGLGRTVRPIERSRQDARGVDRRSGFAESLFRHLVEGCRRLRDDQRGVARRDGGAAVNRFPDRFLFGTDALAPPDSAAYLDVYSEYAPLWKRLTPEASDKVRLGNYITLFDQARRRVRAWERANTP